MTVANAMAKVSRALRSSQQIAVFPGRKRQKRSIWGYLLFALAAVFGSEVLVAHANSPTGRVQPERPPVVVKLCSSFMDHEITAGPRCSNGASVRRTLLVPYFLNSRPEPIQTWKVGLTIYLTEHGLAFLPQALALDWSQYSSDHVWLAAGWSGLYSSDLERFMDSTSRSEPDHRLPFAWDKDSDPDFDIYSASGSTENNGYPKRLLVPKAGDQIFFQYFNPVVRAGTLIDSLCSVRDYTSPQHDSLEYSLRYSQLKHWRRYSKRLWDYVDSITVGDAVR